MNPTPEQLKLAAAFCGVEISTWSDDRLPWIEVPSVMHADQMQLVMWQPTTDWQGGGPLLAKVEKWLDEFRFVTTAVANAALEYTTARASGDSQQWLEAGFMLACAIQEASDGK